MWGFLAELLAQVLGMFVERLDRPDTAVDLKATEADKKKHKRLIDAKDRFKGIDI